MGKRLFLKMLRDLRKSASAYLICVLVIIVGFAGYSLLGVVSEQLVQSRDYFFTTTRFPQVFAEIQEAPADVVRRLEKIQGVRSAQGRLVKTVRVADSDQGSDAELLVASIEPEGLGVPLLSQGSLPPKGSRELVLGDGFFKAHGFKTGEEIGLVISGRPVAFTVSGSGISPENIYMIKTMSDMLPNPAQYDAAFLDYDSMAQAFHLEGRVNNFVMTLEEGYSAKDLELQIKEVLKPYGCYRVYGRDKQLSASMLQAELDQLARMANVLPLLFLSITGVILYIALHRLIEQQRTQIGTLMALGIPPLTIRLHYLGYGAFLGFLGGLLGGLYGSLAAGPMADFYRIYFSLPNVSATISYHYLLIGTAMATLFCAAVSWFSVGSSGRLTPAEALRPAAPKAVKVSALERLPLLKKALTMPGLMAVRCLSRNPRRSALSLCGIACAYMITAALLSMNSLFDVFLFDYLEKTQQQDLTVSFDAPVSKSDAERAIRDPSVELAEGIVELPVTLRGPKGLIDCTIQGIPMESALCRLYAEDGRTLSVEKEGILLSRHMADLMGVSVGDRVEVEVSYPETRISSAVVTGICAQYLGSSAYMSLQNVGRISEYRNVYTSVLLRVPQEYRQQFKEQLEKADHVSTVLSRQEKVEQYRTMMGSMGGIMAGMALMGVLIGVAVIYTSSLISFEELKREIASMRMLGLSDRQCLDVVSVGQWILTFAAILPGIPMTMGISRLISTSMTTDLYSIPDFVDAGSMLLAVVLTFAAVAVSSQIIYRKIKKAAPVELLRERE